MQVWIDTIKTKPFIIIAFEKILGTDLKKVVWLDIDDLSFDEVTVQDLLDLFPYSAEVCAHTEHGLVLNEVFQKQNDPWEAVPSFKKQHRFLFYFQRKK